MANPTNLPNSLASFRVLLIDDDEFMLSFVEGMLRDLGVTQLSRALDGQAALTLLDMATEAPQLLICDLNMPGMDGIEFFRHLAGRGFEGGVIVSSASDRNLLKSVELLLEAHGLLFLGTLEKPAQTKHLVPLLNNLVELTPKHHPHKLIKMLSPEDIREGLVSGQMEIFFEPKVRMSDWKVVGAECLARWHHPERGIVPPAAFISVAEEYGLIDSLTMAIFRDAVKQLAEWKRAGHSLKLSVNVSMDNLERLSLPEEFADMALQAGVDVRQITLEITENRLVKNLAASLEIITRLRLKGFSLSIDDFGTGYSSMEKLKQLPFTELKVDRAFVFGAAKESAARAILEFSVHTGRALGMYLVAEGVETQEDWDVVNEVGCDEVQGYFIAKPMPAQQFIAWKSNWDEQHSQE
jgi:EAL domain-containing protein (putative c-di-GMP-specific phosphodiesterase class I)